MKKCAFLFVHIFLFSKLFAQKLDSKDSLKLFFTEDLSEINQWYHIDYFDSGYTYGGGYFYDNNKGPVFSREAIEAIKKLHSGQELVIKIVSVSPRAQHFRIMPIVRFRML